MNPVMDALRTIVPVLLMLFLGALCRKKQLISREGVQALKTVAVQIALPAVLLHTFAVTQYTLSDVLIPSGVSGVLDACTDFVSAPTAALILLAIGYDLVLADIPWRATCAVVGLRLGIMAVLGVLLALALRALWPETHLEAAVALMFLLPPPFVLPVFASGTEQRAYVSAALSVSTLAAIAGFAVLAVLGI